MLASLGYHDYEGVALEADEKPRLVRDLGDKRCLMLRNHGLLTVGAGIADAFVAMYFFETACAIHVRAGADRPMIEIGRGIVDNAQAQWKKVTHGKGGGALAWPALLRRLDRSDPGYAN